MLRIISVENEFPDIETTSFSGNVSLTDYDVVIIDPTNVVSSFPDPSTDSSNRRFIGGQDAHYVLDIIQRRRSEVAALLNKGRLIVTFLDPLFDVKLTSKAFSSTIEINNYSWLPDDNRKRFVNRLIQGTGTGLHLVHKSHLFSSYYSAFQKDLSFNAYVDIPIAAFDLGDAFISNSADLVLGFSFNISNGIVVFLPRFKFNEDNNRKFVGVLLQIAKKHFGSDAKTPPPDWVNAFTVPGVNILDEKIRDVEKKISEIEAQKSEIEKERTNLNDYKSLLFEQGHVLEKKVIDALKLMGFIADTIPGENTDFDVILESEEGRAIAEIEGKDDSAIHKGKIDQLLSAINQDADQRDSFAKGILIGNHYRLKSLDQREEPFTKTVMNLAKQYHYALVTTVDLYNATMHFLQHPDAEDCKKTCRKAILESDGSVVKFPIPDEISNE